MKSIPNSREFIMLPQLIVFDLDFTLWQCGGTYCDCLTPPFKVRNGQVLDRHGRHVQFFPDVSSILDWCDEAGVDMAVASRTDEPDWASQLLRLLDAYDRFRWMQIFPGSKIAHFEELKKDSGLRLEDMLFFDDEMRNITEVSQLGVTSIYVESGLDTHLFDSGLQQFAEYAE